ncbi:SLC13 family permease, partial [Planctomycetota bacterium]
KPFVIGEIVSSNLGGASSMIGDFPNMLIASETGLQFHDFVLYMMPPCLVLLGVTILFMKSARPRSAEQQHQETLSPPRRRAPASAPCPAASRPQAKRKRALAVLITVVVAFLFCGRFGIAPATVAMAGGFVILLSWSRAAPQLLLKAGFSDVMFFLCLFVLVGAVEASGFLDILANGMLDLSGGSSLGLALLLMWVAAMVTTFLSAGPTTALFAPIVLGLGTSASHGLYWWALSLGVCAGSSATITGATAGPVALTKLREFLDRTQEAPGSLPAESLTFVDYARTGVPLMGLFLLLSSGYVAILSL